MSNACSCGALLSTLRMSREIVTSRVDSRYSSSDKVESSFTLACPPRRRQGFGESRLFEGKRAPAASESGGRPPYTVVSVRARSEKELGAVVSDVVVEEKLVRGRPQAVRLNLVFAFVVEPHLDQVLREHVTAQQELVVPLERVQRLIEGRGHTRHVLQLLWRE